MSGKSSPEGALLDTVKDEIHSLLCMFKGSITSEQLLSNVFLHPMLLHYIYQLFKSNLQRITSQYVETRYLFRNLVLPPSKNC